MTRPIHVLRFAGLLLCALSAGLALAVPFGRPLGSESSVLLALLLPSHFPKLGLLFIEFFVPIGIAWLFWICTEPGEAEIHPRRIIALLSLQTILAFLVANELDFVIAIEAGLLLAPRIGLPWAIGQAFADLLVAFLRPELMSWTTPSATTSNQQRTGLLIFMGVAVLYNFLAYILGLMAALEAKQRWALDEANAKLARTNRDLLLAQDAIRNAAKSEERLELARELHDAIGHQLTALSVNLQIATRLRGEQAAPHVEEAYGLTRTLLTDLRTVVNTMRQPSASNDFRGSLEELVSRVVSPAIHLNFEELLSPLPAYVSHELFRCAQGIVTNAIRHSGAKNVWINCTAEAERFHFEARDDGRGAPELTRGNGLRGIEERVAKLNGSFHVKSQFGFQVSFSIPIGVGS